MPPALTPRGKDYLWHSIQSSGIPNILELCPSWRAECDPHHQHAQHLLCLTSPFDVVVTLQQNLELARHQWSLSFHPKLPEVHRACTELGCNELVTLPLQAQKVPQASACLSKDRWVPKETLPPPAVGQRVQKAVH